MQFRIAVVFVMEEITPVISFGSQLLTAHLALVQFGILGCAPLLCTGYTH